MHACMHSKVTKTDFLDCHFFFKFGTASYFSTNYTYFSFICCTSMHLNGRGTWEVTPRLFFELCNFFQLRPQSDIKELGVKWKKKLLVCTACMRGTCVLFLHRDAVKVWNWGQGSLAPGRDTDLC